MRNTKHSQLRILREDAAHKINITHFAVDFNKEKAKIDVKGLGGKIMSKLTNKVWKELVTLTTEK